LTPYSLNIKESLCWGCKTCEVACKAENRAPKGVKLIEVGERGPWVAEGGEVMFQFTVNRCRHCQFPPCVAACGERAIEKRADGIVVLDQEACAACMACMDACPFDAIQFDEKRGVAAKCNLCHHRIDRGLLPACADNVCPAHCIHLEGAEVTQ
jgi:Fe-S-cluster-containing dehydrogenase component